MPEISGATTAPPRATLGGVTPILRVADLDASVAYHRDRLGFQPQWRAGSVASVGRDGASLVLSEGDRGRRAPKRGLRRATWTRSTASAARGSGTRR